MAGATVFTGVRRRISPIAGAFFTPSDLTDFALVQSLASISGDLVIEYSDPVTAFPFQKRNARSLLLKVKILASIFESLIDSSSLYLSPSALVCLRELYILVFRSRLLLDHCSQSGRLWLLIQNPKISGHFHDLNQEIATILDVFPISSLGLAVDLQEQLRLLQRQLRRSRLYIDPQDEEIRLMIYSFVNEFEKGSVPDPSNLRIVFVDRLGITNAHLCRTEIEFLDELIRSSEEDCIDVSVLGGIVALTRYCRFLLFGLVERLGNLEQRCNFGSESSKKLKMRVLFKGSGDISFVVPKDFCCPISLDVMRDPVTISTGQTYDRSSITQWMEEGHRTCPNSGQILSHKWMVENVALRSLISQWCSAQGVACGPPNGSDASADAIAAASSSRAAVEANKATSGILVGKLDDGLEAVKTIAARELRLLAKTGKENRACIAEAGAIPLLHKLMCSSNAVAQENSMTAILNLSIHERNKSKIMEEEGCLSSIINILRHGQTMEAKENAAATLFSLSAVHDYKKRIVNEPGAVEALAGLLRNGSQRGKRDAVTALFNLSTHYECCLKMMELGAVWALLEASSSLEGVAEEAIGALAFLVREQTVAEVVGRDDAAVGCLMKLMRRGTPKAKENAVVVLHELCKSGGDALTQRLAKIPALCGLIQTLLLTGTKRARRKAASVARMCQRCEPEVPPSGGAGWGLEYAMARSSSMRQSSSFVGSDVSVSVARDVSVSVARDVSVSVAVSVL